VQQRFNSAQISLRKKARRKADSRLIFKNKINTDQLPTDLQNSLAWATMAHQL
jgi:hypothetical protein